MVTPTAKYAQLVRETNKAIRLEWAKKMLETGKLFDMLCLLMSQLFRWSIMLGELIEGCENQDC